MMTLRMFETAPPSIPYITASYLSDLGVSLGKQELYTKQSPQKLKALREHALIESAVSSNRIEGVTVDQSRVATIVFGKPHLRDRDEEEVRGYRNALKWIHEKAKAIDFSEETVKRLHALSRNETGDAGQYKETQNDIIEKYPGGGERIRLRPETIQLRDAEEIRIKTLASRLMLAVRRTFMRCGTPTAPGPRTRKCRKFTSASSSGIAFRASPGATFHRAP